LNLRANLLANYAGQGWRALMNVLFIPIYVHYLGVEAYGLVGLYSLLQNCLTMVDVGMRPTLAREMARFTAGLHDIESIRDLLRSVLIVASGVAVAIVVVVALASTWLATRWLTLETLTHQTVTLAVIAMGFVIGGRLVESVLVSAIAGLQKQVLHNVITSIMATICSAGAIAVLAWIGQSITAFFVWQGLASIATIAVLATAIHRILPPGTRPARFSMGSLRRVRRFAAGMTVVTALALLLTQIDKVLLSRLLALKVFSVYSIAGAIAGALSVVAGPINGAFNPRLAELVARGDSAGLRATYHQGAQLIAVLMGPAAFMLIMFAPRLILAWTADPRLTAEVAPFVPILALATLLNGLMSMPYQLQLAYGWTRLMVQTSLVAVIFLVPAIVVLVPRYGAMSAAWSGVALNCAYLIFSVYLMHRRVLPTERRQWYLHDVAWPLSAAALTAWLWRLFGPTGTGRVTVVVMVAAGCVLSALSALLAAPLVRRTTLGYLSARWRSVTG
jgi:O-antigen/teichoic acid export membrane protein